MDVAALGWYLAEHNADLLQAVVQLERTKQPVQKLAAEMAPPIAKTILSHLPSPLMPWEDGCGCLIALGTTIPPPY